MPLFEYKAVDPSGETVQGTMEAASLDLVVLKLQEAGNIPLQARESGSGGFGLAGLRLGLLAGPAAWLDEFDKVRLPYNINVLTQASAEFALRHREVFDAQTRLIRSERERLAAGLARLPGVTVYPSQANFLLLRTPPGRAAAWFAGLRERGVLIKNLDGAHPLLTDCLRPTVGTPEENGALLTGLAGLAFELP